jgi:hypothetical protein
MFSDDAPPPLSLDELTQKTMETLRRMMDDEFLATDFRLRAAQILAALILSSQGARQTAALTVASGLSGGLS